MQNGEAFERYIMDRVRADGFDLIHKTDPPVNVVRWFGGNQFKGHFLEQGPLDLTGSAKGYHVEIEVKDNKGIRWPLSKLRPHQLERMARLQKDQAISGLALRLRGANANEDFIYLVPSREVIKLAGREKKSITLDDMQSLEKDGLVIRHSYHNKGDILAFFDLVLASL